VILSLKNSGQEIDALRQQNIQRETVSISFQNEINVKINNYEQTIFKMTRSQEDIHRKLSESEHLLKQKYEEYQRLETNYRNVSQ